MIAGGVAAGLAQSTATHGTAAHGGSARTHATGSAENGQAVFQHNCVMCHAVQPGVTIVGPSLAGEMKKGPHAKTPREVTGILLNGKGRMPAMRERLSDQEVADVLAYLKTL